ncbi:MAG: hypothetical protein ACLRUB_01600 [Streptococcus sp.]
MSEPLFLQSVMQEKFGVARICVMSLATIFQATMLESTGLSRSPKWCFYY